MKILCRKRENLVGELSNKECKVNQRFIWESRAYNKSTLESRSAYIKPKFFV
jgi:hypothetical protein